MEMRIPPPLIDAVALIAIVLLWAFAPALQLKVPVNLAIILGLLLIAIGLYLPLSAIGLFRQKKTTILPFTPEKTAALVTEGVYNYTRNPMYLGMAMVLIGAVFITRQPLGFVIIWAACAYLTRFQIKPEERILEQKFGQNFIDYKQRVRRWI